MRAAPEAKDGPARADQGEQARPTCPGHERCARAQTEVGDRCHQIQHERAQAVFVGLHEPLQRPDHRAPQGQASRFQAGLRHVGSSMFTVGRRKWTERALRTRLTLQNAAIPGDACASRG